MVVTNISGGFMNVSTQQKLKDLLAQLSITEDQFFDKTGLSASDTQIDSVENSNVMSILSIFDQLQVWFDSPSEAWHWFTQEKIRGFGALTASEVVVQNSQDGVNAVLDYIESKNLGGFE